MRTGRDAIVRAVDAVVEGTGAVDWGLITIELDNDRDRELLRHIRLLSQISDIQRTEAGALREDERTLRARAHTIASLLPFEVRPRPSPDDVAAAEAPTVSQDLGEPEVVARWGRLELLELVGKGTFGDVYRARDSQLQREVAVKLLHVNRRRDGLVDRMLHEGSRRSPASSTRTSSPCTAPRSTTGASGCGWSSSAGARSRRCSRPMARSARARPR